MTPQALFEKSFGRAPDAVAVAPGRLEFIGNHTDYNGGLVMGVAVDRGVTCAVAKRKDDRLVFHSAEMDIEARAKLGEIRPLSGEASWANYALGVFDQLLKAGMVAEQGFDMAVSADLPFGAGMSSSAAFELSAGRALGALYGFELETADWARLARRAENQFVGVPCGILDQGVSAFGQKDKLVRIDCTTETFERVPLPAGVHFWVFNSGVKHALLDSLYATRHRECMEALKTLKKGLPELPNLCAATPEMVQAQSATLGPELTKRARHVVEEHARVLEMEKVLAAGDLSKAGSLLLASHESSRDLFENSVPELDFLVEQLRGLPGVYGCRLTGGGFGGAVMSVTSAAFTEEQAKQVAEAYAGAYGHPADTFHMLSGEGARLI